MAKSSKKSRCQEPTAPLAEPVHRIATRRVTADRKLRILERLTSGLSVVEQLTVQRVRQIVAALEKREADTPS
jgi:hypothetical protein